MDRDILGSFYNRLLPLFPPRTETFLKSLTSEKLKQVNFRYIFTVDGMTEISHMIEDIVNKNPASPTRTFHFSIFRASRINRNAISRSQNIPPDYGFTAYPMRSCPKCPAPSPLTPAAHRWNITGSSSPMDPV